MKFDVVLKSSSDDKKHRVMMVEAEGFDEAEYKAKRVMSLEGWDNVYVSVIKRRPDAKL